jgi:thiosulfate/3-mercaptopyruvate sulfurtransferase
MPSFIPVSRACTNLTGSGDLRLLSDRSLKSALATYYAAVKVTRIDDFPLPPAVEESSIAAVISTGRFRNILTQKRVITTDLLNQHRTMLERTREVLLLGGFRAHVQPDPITDAVMMEPEMIFPDRLLKLFVLAGLAALGGCSEGPTPPQDGDQATPAMDTLVSAQWLMEHIGDPDLVVLDATVIIEPDASGNLQAVNGRAAYEAGHIPTAGFADLMGELSDPESPLQFGMPSPEQFAAAMSALGVGDNSRVVLYDSMGSSWAARVWWMLRWVGFDRAALLDGGLNAWTAAGGELSTEPVSRPAQTLTVNLRPELIADEEEVRDAIGNNAVRLVDSLPEIHYRGEWTMYDRPGHIPGAVNVPVTSLFDETGHFRPDGEQALLFGGDRETRTITYCGGGIAASSDAFVLTRLGYRDVAIYAASLEEWTANPDNPMDILLDEFGKQDE